MSHRNNTTVRKVTVSSHKFTLTMNRRFDWTGEGYGQAVIVWPKGRRTPAGVIVHLTPELKTQEGSRALYQLCVELAKNSWLKAGIPIEMFERINWFVPLGATAVKGRTIVPRSYKETAS